MLNKSAYAFKQRMEFVMNVKKSQIRWGYFFIAPAIIGFAVFYLGPMLFSLFSSFFSWNVVTPMQFIGFENYLEMFSDNLVWKSLRITMVYTLMTVPLVITVSFLLANLLNCKIRGTSLFRTVFYLPSIVPVVAVAAVWRYMYDPMYGLFNSILRLLNLPTTNWIYSQETILPSISIIAVWVAGNTVIIFLAGLQGISPQLYEAAEIDGAGIVRKFINITVPTMTPIIFYNVVIAIIGSFQSFALPYVLIDGAGGPNNSALFYPMLLYQTALKYNRMGYAASMSWFLFAIIALLTVVMFKTSDMWVFSNNEKIKNRK